MSTKAGFTRLDTAFRPRRLRSSMDRCTNRSTLRSRTAIAMSRDLAAVFQGRHRATRMVGRPIPPARHWSRRSPDGGRRGQGVLRHGHGGDRSNHAGASARGRSRRVERLPVRQHQQPVQHDRGARHRRDLRRRHRRARMSRRRSRRRRVSCSSRRSPTRARRSPISNASASCAPRAASSTSWTTP